MENNYQNPVLAKKYLDYLDSPAGSVYREIMSEAVRRRLPPENGRVLDAACGSGWLTNEIFRNNRNAEGCDSSEILIAAAKARYPEITFSLADLAEPLPYPPESFDMVILCMAAQDIIRQKTALENLKKILKPGGKILISVANPYYMDTVGSWKRGWPGFLLRQKPVFNIARPYNLQKNSGTAQPTNPQSRFQPLAELLNNFIESGFCLTYFEDLKSPRDSGSFNLKYQLYRFPIILLMEFSHRPKNN